MFARARISALAVVALGSLGLTSAASAQDAPRLCGGAPVTMLGTPGDDRLIGTEGPDVISGLQGNDVIEGLGGDDIICGGIGDDVIFGDGGFDILFGAQGDDTLVSASGAGDELRSDIRGARMFGGAGNDRIIGSNRWDRMQGGLGNDVLSGFEGRDWMRGGAGSDQLDGGPNIDNLHGGNGADELAVTNGDIARGGNGVDRCKISSGMPAQLISCIATPVTMWDVLVGSGEAANFAAIGAALGLQPALENPTVDGQRTFFAASDAAIASLGPAELNELAADPNAANARIGYHFLPGALVLDDLIALDGQSVAALTGLPLLIDVVDGEVVLNGTARIVTSNLTADNGVVHIIDTMLTPPTVNGVIALETLNFNQDSAAITSATAFELDLAVGFFAANPQAIAVLEGHASTDEESGPALSQARAEAVVEYLIDNGVAANHLDATSAGSQQPILVDGVEDKAASRRVEFIIR